MISKEVWAKGITEGIKQGLFGLGELQEEQPVCHFFKEEVTVAFSVSEVIIREDFCALKRKEEKGYSYPPLDGAKTSVKDTDIKEKGAEEALVPPEEIPPEEQSTGYKKVYLCFTLPKGKVASIMGVMNFLQSKFNRLEVKLIAEEGEISAQDYEDKIREAFRQLGIELGDRQDAYPTDE